MYHDGSFWESKAMRRIKTLLSVLGAMAVSSAAWAQAPTSVFDAPNNSTPKPVAVPVMPAVSYEPGRPAQESEPKAAITLPGVTFTGEAAKAKQTIYNDSALLPDTAAAVSSTDCRKGCRSWFVFGDILVWRVHGTDTAFGQAFDGVDPFFSAPKGPVGSTHFGFEPGFRLGGGVALTDCSWLVGTFTYFRNTSDASLNAPDTTVIRSLVVLPQTVNALFVPLAADAHLNINLSMGDIDYKCSIINNDHLQLSWLAGVRIAHVSQSFNANYAVFGVTSVNTNITFNGAGPRAGLHGEYQMGCGFYGFGKGMLNLIAGRFNADYLQQATFNGVQAQTSVTEDRLVPVLEAELGIGWASTSGRVHLAAGYYVGTWCNSLTTPTFINGVQNNLFTTNGNNFRDNLTFDGFFARVELRY
jgi:hypothetical protein